MNAIEKVNGPCVILAGAGTGKTYAIVEKMKHLVQIGVKPERIVCITFSNEAANNLVLRIEKILGINGNSNNASKPVIRTFHGFSADLLRSYGDKIGIGKEFKILDPDQAKVILHRNLKVNVINCVNRHNRLFYQNLNFIRLNDGNSRPFIIVARLKKVFQIFVVIFNCRCSYSKNFRASI